MRKDTIYVITIPLVIYPFTVVVFMNETDEEIIERLVKAGNDRDEAERAVRMSGVGRTLMAPSNDLYIRLAYRADKNALMGTIAHEVFHAVTMLMDVIGMKFENGVSDEAYAYPVGYITGEITRELELFNKKKE